MRTLRLPWADGQYTDEDGHMNRGSEIGLHRRAVVVEDHLPDIDVWKKALDKAGFDTVEAPNTSDAVDFAAEFSPDLIVLSADVHNGFNLCLKFRKHAQLKSVPLILTTAIAKPEVIEKHMRLPTRATEYLRKPFNEKALKTVIDRIISTLPPPLPEMDIAEIPDRTVVSGNGLEAAVVTYVEEEVGFLKDIVSRLEDEKTELNDKLASLEDQLRDQHDMLDSGIKVLMERQERDSSESNDTSQKLTQTLETIEHLTSQVRERDTKIAELTKTNDLLDQERTGLIKDKAELAQELEQLRESIEHLTESSAGWKVEKSEFERRQEDLANERAEIETAHEQIKEDMTLTTELFTRLEAGYKEELQKIADEKLATEENLSDCEVEIGNLRLRLDELEAIREALPALQEAAARAEIMHEELEALRARARLGDEAKANVQTLSERVSELEDALANLEHMQAEVVRLTEVEASLKLKKEALEKRFEQLRTILSSESMDA